MSCARCGLSTLLLQLTPKLCSARSSHAVALCRLPISMYDSPIRDCQRPRLSCRGDELKLLMPTRTPGGASWACAGDTFRDSGWLGDRPRVSTLSLPRPEVWTVEPAGGDALRRPSAF